MEQCQFFDPAGIFALRANGFRDTSTALAELVDNSIQAGAKNVEIALIQRAKEGPRKNWQVNEVFISDDGGGMPPEVLQIALRFGGGMRHGAEKGLGKFGMGLPNSSASQCKRFEVYSWQSQDQIFKNYFDFDELKKDGTGLLPLVEKITEFPKIARETAPLNNRSGTVVRWVACDKVKPKRAITIIQHMVVPLGRIFRYYIRDEGVTIRIRVFDDNGHSLSEKKDLTTTIKPVDPLFLMKGCYYPEKCQETGPTNITFADESDNVIEFEEQLEAGGTRMHRVTLKFSIASEETQGPKGGGNTELGKHYKNNAGISVVRANREINLDTFGFIGDISDPRHRWWSCEVNFEPISDDLFGLDNSKQNVHFFKKIDPKDYGMLSEEEEETDPSTQFMFKISQCISGNIAEMLKTIKERHKGQKSKPCRNPKIPDCSGKIINGTCNTCGFTPTYCEIHPNIELVDGVCHLCNFHPVVEPPIKPEDPDTEEKEKLRKELKSRYQEYQDDDKKLDLAVDWFFKSPNKQIIIFDNMGKGPLYDYTVIGARTLIEVNSNHEFYDTFVEPAFESGNTDALSPILLLFGSLVEAERNGTDSDRIIIDEFRGQLGLKLNKAIRYWKQLVPQR